MDYWVQTATPDLILGVFKDSQDNDYIMVNNREIDGSRQSVLSFPQDVTSVAAFDKRDGLWIDLTLTTLENRALVEFILAPGDGELLKVVPEPATLGLLLMGGLVLLRRRR